MRKAYTLFSLAMIISLSFAEAQTPKPAAELWQQENQFRHAQQLSDSFVYCYLEIPVGPLQNQILLTGMTLWLEPGGKKKARKGLLYPLGLAEQQIPRDPFLFVRFLDDISFPSRQRLASPPEMLVIGYYGGAEDDVLTASPQTKGALAIFTNIDEENVLHYCARIPRSALDGKTTWRWGFETGKLPRPDMRATDAVGLSTGINDTPETRQERAQARYLDTYRLYGDESRWRSGKNKISEGE
ncbi:MAG: hypothetical protein AAFQ68_07900 [Bacteroidota bacterium]